MASMIPITAFMPLVLPFAPTVPEPVAEQMIRLAAIEFCERTRCWRHIANRRIDAFNGGTASGTIRVLPPYATIFEFEFAYFNGEKLEPLQFSDIDVPSDDEGPEIGVPRYITQTEPNSVRMIPLPEESGSLHLSMFLKPIAMDEWEGSAYDRADDDDLNVLPDFLLTQQGETIQHGALARILAIPGQSYTDPSRSEFYRLSFASRLDTRFATNVMGQHKAQPRTRPQNF